VLSDDAENITGRNRPKLPLWLIGLLGLAGIVVIFLIGRSFGGVPVSPAPTLPGPGFTQAPLGTPVPTSALVAPTMVEVVLTKTPSSSATPPPSATPTMPASPTPALGIGSTQTGKDGMILLYVPAGPFMMGSDKLANEQLMHQVTLDAFWIDQTEVTNAMYAQCVKTGPCLDTSDVKLSDPVFVDYPVVWITWNKAKVYCEWVGRRLPSEAEWEKAARGTDGRTYPWGEVLDPSFANYENREGTTKVGSFESGKSPYGAYDMAGNVWEWVADWYGPYSSAASSNPTGPASGKYRVLRGGSWFFGWGSLPISAYRKSINPSYSHQSVGFRCSVSQ
jgi:formylglycine-generating enzyme required for sulfatase activity